MSPLSNAEGWCQRHCWARLGLEPIVVIGRVRVIVALEVVGARVFIIGEKPGLGGGCYCRQSVLKKRNQENVLASRWSQYTEVGAGHCCDCHWARLTLEMAIIVG